MAKERGSIIPVERVVHLILWFRGQKVITDSDLAALYGVETKVLVRAVKRNIERFPPDFMFQLNEDEFNNLRCQNGTSSQWGGRRYPPYVFNEHGSVMAASVLNSKRAVDISIYVVRAFMKMRQMLATHKSLALKLEQLEQKLQTHDTQIRTLVNAIRQLALPAKTEPKTPIGFHSEAEAHKKRAKKVKRKK